MDRDLQRELAIAEQQIAALMQQIRIIESERQRLESQLAEKSKPKPRSGKTKKD